MNVSSQFSRRLLVLCLSLFAGQTLVTSSAVLADHRDPEMSMCDYQIISDSSQILAAHLGQVQNFASQTRYYSVLYAAERAAADSSSIMRAARSEIDCDDMHHLLSYLRNSMDSLEWAFSVPPVRPENTAMYRAARWNLDFMYGQARSAYYRLEDAYRGF